MSRYALLVGVSEYISGLNPLPATLNDLKEFNQVLTDYGEFNGNINTVQNPSTDDFKYHLESLFTKKSPSELVLFYYSGHGLLNENATKAYLCSRQTEQKRLASTSISSSFLLDLINECRAKQILILDCCFSSDIAKNIQATTDVVILASSNNSEYSHIGEDLSLYTQYLIEAVKNKTIFNDDNILTAASLHEYIEPLVCQQQEEMNPKIWAFKAGYSLPIAWNNNQEIIEPVINPPIVVEEKVEYKHSNAVMRYLEGILEDGDNNTLQNIYIDLSVNTEQKTTELSEKSSFSKIIPSSFALISEHFNKNTSETKYFDSINEICHLHSRFILLGAPGAGKTTSLKKLKLDYAKQAQQDPKALIPIYFNVAEWSEKVQEINDLIQNTLITHGLSIDINQLLILLDGLNEVSMEYYQRLIKRLNRWFEFESSKTVSIVISCRKKHYLNHQRLTIPEVHIEPLDDPRIQSFLKAYLGETKTQQILPQLGALDPQQRSPRDLIHLANNPFFLAMICYVYIENKSLPQSRGELFRIFVNILYANEENKNTTQGLKKEELLAGFSAIAFAMQKNRLATSMHITWAEKQLPKNINKNKIWALGGEIRLLKLSKNKRLFQFTHQLYLEYFAAEGLLIHFKDLAKYISRPKFYNGNRNSSAWDEVVYTLMGIINKIENTDELLNRISAIDPFLAVECLNYLPTSEILNPEIQNQIIHALIQYLDSYSNEIRTATINILSKMGSITIPILNDYLISHQKPVIKRACLKVLGRFDDEDAIKLVLLGLVDTNSWIRKDSLNLILDYNKEQITKLLIILIQPCIFEHEKREQIFYLLFDNAVFDDVESEGLKVFTTKLKSISYYPKKDKTIKIARKHLNNHNSIVRIKALTILYQSKDKNIIEIAQKFLNDEHSTVRVKALTILYELKDENIIEIARKFLNNENSDVRSQAFSILYQSKDKNIIEIARKFLNNKNPVVRLKSLTVLYQSKDKNIIEIARKFLNHENSNFITKTLTILYETKNENIIEIIQQLLNNVPKQYITKIFYILQSLSCLNFNSKKFNLPSLPSLPFKIMLINKVQERTQKIDIKEIQLLINDSEPRIQIAATNALLSIQPKLITSQIALKIQNQIKLFLNIFQYESLAFKISLLYLLPKLQNITLIKEFLIPQLTNKNAALRRVSVLSLGQLNPEMLKEFKPNILLLEQDPALIVREAVQKVLSQ